MKVGVFSEGNYQCSTRGISRVESFRIVRGYN